MPIETVVQIVCLSLIILVPAMLWRTAPSWWAVSGCVAYTASYFISNLWQIAYVFLQAPQAYGFALRLYQFSTLLLIFVYLCLLFLWLTRDKPTTIDTQAKLVWLILLIAEGWSVVEYLECKVFVDPFGDGDFLLSQIWGIEVSRFACGRRFGAISPYVAPIITSLYLIWINWRAGSIGPTRNGP